MKREMLLKGMKQCRRLPDHLIEKIDEHQISDEEKKDLSFPNDASLDTAKTRGLADFKVRK